MAFALAIACLCSILAASCVLIVQGIQAQIRDHHLMQQKQAGEFIESLGRMVSPAEIAHALGTSDAKAHQLLCSMVDEQFFTMSYDDSSSAYRFGFTPRHAPQKPPKPSPLNH